jgi:hypothetical protein
MFWFRSFRKVVAQEADEAIRTYGEEAYRYAQDRARYAQRLYRTRDVEFYSEVAKAIAARIAQRGAGQH